MNNTIKNIEDWSVNNEFNKNDKNKQLFKIINEVGKIANELENCNSKKIRTNISNLYIDLVVLQQQLENDDRLMSKTDTSFLELFKNIGELVENTRFNHQYFADSTIDLTQKELGKFAQLIGITEEEIAENISNILKKQ